MFIETTAALRLISPLARTVITGCNPCRMYKKFGSSILLVSGYGDLILPGQAKNSRLIPSANPFAW
jgi:hypothetical protein